MNRQPTHPVDALAQLWPDAAPEALARARAICDAPLVKSQRVQIMPALDEDGNELSDCLTLHMRTPLGVAPAIATWSTISLELAVDRRGLAYAIRSLRETARLRRQQGVWKP